MRSPILPNGDIVESLVYVFGGTVDWDSVLRQSNTWFDRFVDASHRPTHKERKEAIDKVQNDFKLAKSVANNKIFGISFLTAPRRAISERAGYVIYGLMQPIISAAVEAEDRSVMGFQVTELAFALAAYRAEHGSYPEKLDELMPKYVSEVPKDMFNEAELHYERQPGGYLLYSVGVNGIDDGGKGYEDFVDGRQTDDLVVRIPSDEKQP